MVSKLVISAAATFMGAVLTASAFIFPSFPSQCIFRSRNSALAVHKERPAHSFDSRRPEAPSGSKFSRRPFLATIVISTTSFVTPSGALERNAPPALASEGKGATSPNSFESISARAARVSEEVIAAEREQKAAEEAAVQRRQDVAKKIKEDTRTIYDFTLPVGGKTRQVADLVGQTFSEGIARGGGEGDASEVEGTRAKAILVVNIKQDDPIARKNIPELIALASKFGKNGEFAVIVSPTDQGYYEPDTSALIRLKLEQEYGYGNTPGTILTDKVNLLGTGAVPFWRWLEGNCRTPAGLGKIQANFEKFLVDGRTGKPLRRYPRKYQPYDIADDIASVISGRPLPPAQKNYKEEWRNAAKEAENDTYRFQKGLNYFDQ